MPYKSPEMRKQVKRNNYLKNSEAIKMRMAWNRRKKKLLEFKMPKFTEQEIRNQIALIGSG